MAMVMVILIIVIISKPSHDDGHFGGNEQFDEDKVGHLNHFDIFESTSLM
jgi:ABC-type cobalt transport system substrate-binding protein